MMTPSHTHPTSRPRRSLRDRRTGRRRAGYTLVELLMSTVSTAVLMAGLTSAIYVASQAASTSNSTGLGTATALSTADFVGELAIAKAFRKRGATTVEFTIADRDGNTIDEIIEYTWNGIPGNPLIRSYNGVAATAAENVDFLSLAYTTQPATISRRILFVYGNGTASQATHDTNRRNQMKGWNYSIIDQLVTPATSPAEIDAVLTTVDAVYISSTATSADVGTKLKNATRGVLIEEGELYDDFSLSTATGPAYSSTATNLPANTHYITSAFSPGTVTILTANQDLRRLVPTRAAGLQVLGNNIGTQTDPNLAVINEGLSLVDGTRCAGPRVALPWGGEEFDPTKLNTNGQTLWQRALEWVTGEIVLSGVDLTLQLGPSTSTRTQTRVEIIGRPRP